MWPIVLTTIITFATLPCTLRANTAWSYYTPPLLYDVSDLTAHNAYIPFAPFAHPDLAHPQQQPTPSEQATTNRPPATTTPSTTTTEFFLPEIIVNRQAQPNRARIAHAHFAGYPPATKPRPVYLPASTSSTTTSTSTTAPRPAHRDPPLPTRQYLPADETVFGNNYHYDPPPVSANDDQPSNGYLPASGSLFAGRHFRNLVATTFQPQQQPSTSEPIRLALNHMSCLVPSDDDDDDGTRADRGYFKALLTVQSPQTVRTVPVVDSPLPSTTTTTTTTAERLDDCGIRLLNKSTLIAIDLPAAHFPACGVQRCSASDAHHLCLRMRFPQIAGMWTVGDAVLTLQCRVQAPIAGQTHAVRLGVQRAAAATGRANGEAPGTLAHGGSQLPLHTEISLARIRRGPANGAAAAAGLTAGHVEPLAPGATVQLGDELLLRAQVKAGDGWSHTRMAEVRLQRLGADGGVLHEAQLIDADGCVPAGMRTVCPAGRAVFEPPLGQRLAFRAVMFRGMRSGDEMVLSVRVVGCLRAADCLVVDERCQQQQQRTDERRRRRDADPNAGDLALLSFRVEMPPAATSERSDGGDDDEDKQRTLQRSRGVSRVQHHPVGFIAIVATLSLIVLALIIGLYVRKRVDK